MSRRFAVLGIAVLTVMSLSGFAAAPTKVSFSCRTKDVGAVPCGSFQVGAGKKLTIHRPGGVLQRPVFNAYKGRSLLGRISVGAAERQVIWTNRGSAAVTVSMTVEPYLAGSGAAVSVSGNYEIG